ncbi:MAG: histidine phosphatase family protein [Micropruina sp.]|uniref:histidine phosphatase family protein n=1 Tax=Micropruina sp. TaxID=2737536 RepID=UPI0039E6EC93
MTDLYLCRHGRTPLNAAGVLRGRQDPDLDEVGRAQAQALAERLAGVHPARVVSSPLRRAVRTATPLADAAGRPVQTDPRLIDRSYGRFDGTAAEPLIARYGSLDAAPGVEPAAEFAERVLAAANDWASGPGPVVLVTHDAAIRILLATLLPDAGVTQLDTGGSVLLTRDADGWLLAGA